MGLWGYGVLRLCGCGVMGFYGYAVIGLWGYEVMGFIYFIILLPCKRVRIAR